MPAFLPFEAVVTFVAIRREHADGLLYRNVSRTGEHVMTILFALSRIRHGVLEVSVACVLAHMCEGIGRLFAFDTGVMRVPEEPDVLRIGAFENGQQVFGAPKL